MNARQWSERVFAAYIPDGVFGRLVGTAETREDAELLAAQALRNETTGSNRRRIGAPGGSAQTLGPPDDLTPAQTGARA